MLSLKTLDRLAQYPNRELDYIPDIHAMIPTGRGLSFGGYGRGPSFTHSYNLKMRAAQRTMSNRWATKLARQEPAHALRFRKAGDMEWQELAGDGQLAMMFLEAERKEYEEAV